MKRSKFIIGLTATALVLPLGAMIGSSATETAPPEATAWTEWISDDGGSAGRELPAMSADGRYVALAARSNEFAGIWVKDRAKPGVPAKRVAEGFLFNPAISADGTTVAWALYGGTAQVYSLKWQNPDAVPRLVSQSDNEVMATANSDYPSVSGNGRYIAFQSMDEGLDAQAVPGKEGGNQLKAYVRDMKLGTTEMVSVVGTNTIANGSGIKPDITPDGRYVAFASDSTALQGIEEEGEGELSVAAPDEEEEPTTFQQVYLRDRLEKETIPISVALDGTTFGDGASATAYGPTVSDSGVRVAFESDATNLVADDTNENTDAFVRLRGAQSTVRVSVRPGGVEAELPNPVIEEPEISAAAPPEDGGDEAEDLTANVGQGAVISGDGKFVAFESLADLLTTDDNGVLDVYRYRMDTGGISRWSVVADEADPLAFEATGTRIDGESGLEVPAINGTDPTISFDGKRIAFVSHGNLTGRIVEEEDHEVLPAAEETPSDPADPVTSIEPGVYLHRANPEPGDVTPPRSRADSPDVDRASPTKVTYTRFDPGFPRSGVVAVRLYVKKPGWDSFKLLQTDRSPELDGVFTVTTLKEGTWRFYTRARDLAGNLEARPATADTVTVRK